MARWLIGVDDTDNLESRGTGYRVRQLAAQLEQLGLARIASITRHQLLVHPDIRYTSHNSSACLLAEADAGAAPELARACREFLLAECAPGSDAGLCLAAWEAAGAPIQAWGERAKREVLTQDEARALAREAGITLEGLTGDQGGVIGALAAAGLRAGGNDGRYLWLPGLRELNGVYTVAALREAAHIDIVETMTGAPLGPEERVEAGDWVRPILRAGLALLLVEENNDDGSDVWRVAERALIKQLSN